MHYQKRKLSFLTFTVFILSLFLSGCCRVFPSLCPPPEPSPVFKRTLSTPDVHGIIYDITRFNSKLIAVGKTFDYVAPYGSGQAAVWTSIDNGESWTQVQHNDLIFGNELSAMKAVVVNASQVFAVGEKNGIGTVWNSNDGINWSFIVNAGDELNDIISSPSGLFAVGHSGHQASIWTSSDGQTWSHVFTQSKEHPGSSPPNNIRLSNAYAIAVGAPGDTPEFVTVGYYQWSGWNYHLSPAQAETHRDAAIWTSTNGLNWTMLQPYDPVFAIEHDTYLKNVGLQQLHAVMVQGRAIYVAGEDSKTLSSPASSLLWSSIDGGNTWARYTDEHPECMPAFSSKHNIYALLKPNAFRYGELAVGEMWEDDEYNQADCAIWRGATGYPRWQRFQNSLLNGTSRQCAYGAIGYSAEKDFIVIVGIDGGSPAIWTYTRPNSE